MMCIQWTVSKVNFCVCVLASLSSILMSLGRMLDSLLYYSDTAILYVITTDKQRVSIS